MCFQSGRSLRLDDSKNTIGWLDSNNLFNARTPFDLTTSRVCFKY